jgi:hypothetical protein
MSENGVTVTAHVVTPRCLDEACSLVEDRQLWEGWGYRLDQDSPLVQEALGMTVEARQALAADWVPF